MFKNRQPRAEVSASGSSKRPPGQRWIRAVAICAAAWSLSACGGGGYADSAGNFNIGVTVGGQFVGATPVAAGRSPCETWIMVRRTTERTAQASASFR